MNVYVCVGERDDSFVFSVLHRNCFISFIVCSMAHMVTFLFLYKAGRQPQSYRVCDITPINHTPSSSFVESRALL